MRDISELLDFLNHKMTMAAIYQPAIVLYLLTREGVASRSELARLLSGYEDVDVSLWDRVLMKRPKETLDDKHEIVRYNKNSQRFFLNFELKNSELVEKAKTICEEKIEAWIEREITIHELSENEILRFYRILEIAKRGNQYQIPETNIHLEEFAMQVVIDELTRRYPGEKITQQSYDNFGFDILVGSVGNPIAYVKIKVTEAPQPVFYVSEGERAFSLDNADRFQLAIVYNVNLDESTYLFLLHKGAINHNQFRLTKVYWQAKPLPSLLQKSIDTSSKKSN